MENLNEVIEIKVKAQFMGEFTTWESWLKNMSSMSQKHGVTKQLLHIDANGFATNGFSLKNTKTNVYPVKTYLLIQDPFFEKPLPFISNK